jgi:hypothetical protein
VPSEVAALATLEGNRRSRRRPSWGETTTGKLWPAPVQVVNDEGMGMRVPMSVQMGVRRRQIRMFVRSSGRHTEPLCVDVLALGPGIWGRASFFAFSPSAAVLQDKMRDDRPGQSRMLGHPDGVFDRSRLDAHAPTLSTRKTARSRSQSPPLRAALSGDLIRPPMCPAGFVGWRVFKLSG